MRAVPGPVGVHDGAVTPVRIGLPRATLYRLHRAGTAAPQPVEVRALLDTGAEQSAVDGSVVGRLGVLPASIGMVTAPGVTGFGPVLRYEVGLVVLHPSNVASNHLTVRTLQVAELPLNALGYDALIGRDVLARCVLVYDGLAGTFTLSY